MSSGCGDVLSLEDLKTAKKHQIFEAEVITGLQGGVAGGAAIDYATNQVTGQSQKTLPAILRDAGFRPASFTFATGGTLGVGDSDMAVLWPISAGGDGQYYIWKGTYPKVIPAASTPTSSGGVSDTGWMPLGDITLRGELALSSGAGLIGFNSSLTYSSGTVGNSLVKALTNPQKNIVFATADAGIPNDGTDVSTQVAAFLNANKGKFIVFDSGTYKFAGVELTGTGWEGTTIYFKGKHLLTENTTGQSNKFGAWNGLIINSTVTGLTLHYRGDGNRTNQFDRQHIFNVSITGASSINIPYFEANEIRGDGLYISRGDPVTEGTKQPTDINIGTVIGRNSAQDGRNLVSIITCIRGSISYMYSENIGGVVGGELQPGGLDIEPNAGNDFVVRDFIVYSVDVINGGTGGIAMYYGGVVNPPKIQSCHILKANLRGSGAVRVEGTSNCSINFVGDTLSAVALFFEDSIRTKITGVVNGCIVGARVGQRVALRQCSLDLNMTNVQDTGVLIGGANNCDISLKITTFSPAVGSNLFGLWFRDALLVGGLEQRNNTYLVNIPGASGAARCIEYSATSPITFTGSNVVLPGSNFFGVANYTTLMGAAGLYLVKGENINGMTLAATVPTVGVWRQGDMVRNSAPAAANLTYGWIRLTTGNANVVGTDWGTVKFV